MQLLRLLKQYTPEPVRRRLRPIRNLLAAPIQDKHEAELAFWKTRYELDGGTFKNSHYGRVMLAMAEEPNDDFLGGKVVADFGCGPRGSLVWVHSATLLIGIDVLVDVYANEFSSDITSHGMVYVKSTEKVIPIPTDFVDTLFTVNAIDHVDNFQIMCKELLRILKPGGEIIASFNLEEPESQCEPQQLNEQIIKENLLNQLVIRSYRLSAKGPTEDVYGPFFEGNLSYEVGEEGLLWVRATKPFD